MAAASRKATLCCPAGVVIDNKLTVSHASAMSSMMPVGERLAEPSTRVDVQSAVRVPAAKSPAPTRIAEEPFVDPDDDDYL